MADGKDRETRQKKPSARTRDTRPESMPINNPGTGMQRPQRKSGSNARAVPTSARQVDQPQSRQARPQTRQAAQGARGRQGAPGRVRPSAQAAGRGPRDRGDQGRRREATRGARPQERPGRQRGDASRRPQEAPRNGYVASANVRRREPVSLGRNDPINRKRSFSSMVVAAIVILSVILVGVVWWSNRPVRITVDGEVTTVQVGTTLADVKTELKVNVDPGDIVAVDGETVLHEGEGEEYTVTVDGTELHGDEARTTQVAGGESIEFSNGADTMEAYDVEIVETQPQLAMDESAGAVAYVESWGQVGQVERRTGRESGTVAEGDTVQELVDTTIRVTNVSPDNDRKLVALTFDDGPAEEYTQAYLDILEEYGAKATFFCLGENVEEYPALAQAIVDSGNQICSHTYSHQQLTTLTSSQVATELDRAFSSIETNTGVGTTTIRPPYGDFSTTVWFYSGGRASISCTWNVDSLDWTLPGSDTIVENVVGSVTPGSIILMHDGGGDRSQDVEALPEIIEQLQAKGYTFVTLSELLASDSSIPQDVATCAMSMPEGTSWPTRILGQETTTQEDGAVVVGDSTSLGGSSSTTTTTDEATTA